MGVLTDGRCNSLDLVIHTSDGRLLLRGQMSILYITASVFIEMKGGGVTFDYGVSKCTATPSSLMSHVFPTSGSLCLPYCGVPSTCTDEGIIETRGDIDTNQFTCQCIYTPLALKLSYGFGQLRHWKTQAYVKFAYSRVLSLENGVLKYDDCIHYVYVLKYVCDEKEMLSISQIEYPSLIDDLLIITALSFTFIWMQSCLPGHRSLTPAEALTHGPRLTLYVLNCIYNLYHSSTLTWHR